MSDMSVGWICRFFPLVAKSPKSFASIQELIKHPLLIAILALYVMMSDRQVLLAGQSLSCRRSGSHPESGKYLTTDDELCKSTKALIESQINFEKDPHLFQGDTAFAFLSGLHCQIDREEVLYTFPRRPSMCATSGDCQDGGSF